MSQPDDPQITEAAVAVSDEGAERAAPAPGTRVEWVADLKDLVPWYDGDGKMRHGASVEDGQHDNRRRAGHAASAVVAYAIASGLLNEGTDEDPETAMRSLLVDLQHLAASLRLDYGELDHAAASSYVAEVRRGG